MMNESGRNENLKIVEIERLLEDFKRKFKEGTSNADAFLTMTEMELMWGELQDKTNKIYSDMLREMMHEVDERDLIRKKKGNTANEE